MQAAVSQFLFVCHNAYSANMMLAREMQSLDLETCTPLKPVPDDTWPCALVRVRVDVTAGRITCLCVLCKCCTMTQYCKGFRTCTKREK